MKDKKKLIILSSIILGVLVLTLGLTYAAFTYNRTGETSELVLGDIYMKYTENNQLTLSDAMPTNINKYITYKVNPVMATQEINELSYCVNFLENLPIRTHNGEGFPRKIIPEQGTTMVDFCRGTARDELYRFSLIEHANDQFLLSAEESKFLEENNVLLVEDGSYIINPIMLTQEIEKNELISCVSWFDNANTEYDEGYDAISYCQGTGTARGVKFQEEIDSGEFFSQENLNYFAKNNIIIGKIENLPYFEFTISGKNTYQKEDIWYDIVLTHGDNHETRTERIRDDLLRFALVEVKNNEEEVIFNNRGYETLNNKRIHVETIRANTMDVVNKTYRLYMWIDKNTIIGNVNQDYTMEEWEDVFASIKVGVNGDFVKKEFAYEESTDESCFEYSEISLNNTIGISITNYDETCGRDVVIPKTINGYTVLKIESFAFGPDGYNQYNAKGLTSVVIPDSVVEIGERAFYGNAISTLQIPDSVTTIGEYAFGLNFLEYVVLGANVNNIGVGAFVIPFTYGMTSPIHTIVNKSGNIFNWNEVLGLVYYTNEEHTFATGIVKYDFDGERQVNIIGE